MRSAAGTEIIIDDGELSLIEGGEVVDDSEAETIDVGIGGGAGGVDGQLEDAVAVVAVDWEALRVELRVEGTLPW